MAGFQVDLEDLDRAARQDLPQISSTYRTLATQVSQAKSVDKDLAAEPGVIGSGVFAISWANLRTQVANMLDTSSNNAASIGTDLAHVVDTYAATNSQIQGDLEALNKTLGSA